jgi:uncharacterized integral membrane protein
MRWLRRLLLLAVIVALMVAGWRFASENQAPVTVNYVFGQFAAVELWKVLLASFAAGAGLVALYLLFSSARNGLARHRYRKAIGGLEAEIHQLRNLPLAPESKATDPTSLAPGSDPPGGSARTVPWSARGASGGSG